MNNLEKALEFVFKWEGGHVNNPKDPGGDTNMGITSSTLSAAVKRGIVPADTTIANLTKVQATLIYKSFYWDANSCDKYSLPLCVAVVDSFIQHPISVTKQLIDLGQGDWRKFVQARKDFYTRLIVKEPSMKVFQAGWANRMNDLSKYCEILENDANS